MEVAGAKVMLCLFAHPEACQRAWLLPHLRRNERKSGFFPVYGMAIALWLPDINFCGFVPSSWRGGSDPGFALDLWMIRNSIAVLLLGGLWGVAGGALAGAECQQGERLALSCSTAMGADQIVLCWSDSRARLSFQGINVIARLADVSAITAPDWAASTLLEGHLQYEVFHSDPIAGLNLYQNNSKIGTLLCDPGSVVQALDDFNAASVRAPVHGSSRGVGGLKLREPVADATAQYPAVAQYRGGAQGG